MSYDHTNGNLYFLVPKCENVSSTPSFKQVVITYKNEGVGKTGSSTNKLGSSVRGTITINFKIVKASTGITLCDKRTRATSFPPEAEGLEGQYETASLFNKVIPVTEFNCANTANDANNSKCPWLTHVQL